MGDEVIVGTMYCPLPSCRAPMVRQLDRTGADDEYRCSGWPACREVMPMPESIRLRESGAAELPSFETNTAEEN